jgi:hypothetical protein
MIAVTPTGGRQMDIGLGRGFGVFAIEAPVVIRSPELLPWIMAETGRNLTPEPE